MYNIVLDNHVLYRVAPLNFKYPPGPIPTYDIIDYVPYAIIYISVTIL